MGMNVTEKILCHQAVGLSSPKVTVGEVVVVKVARTLASELTWVGMKQCLDTIGSPEIWRKDRFFLAVDHSVDPRNYDDEVIKGRIKACADFATKVNLTDYWGPNESILHTEFYRQRAEPGSIIVGADSHSCSHGCVGALAMGMGAADVVMPLVTGKTWLKVPETVLISMEGDLPQGMVGKDVMLWILKKFGRNTVALDRCVEYGGNLSRLTVDSRFALSNMATEFGALAGICHADKLTDAFVKKRAKREGLDDTPLYFKPDADAKYYEKLTLNLAEVKPSVARWPNPEDVFTIDDPKLYAPLFDGDKKICDTIRELDGCFVGACTTSESEIVLGGLLLDVAMNKFGMKPKARPDKPYHRKVTPGSQLMIENLEKLGVLDMYRRAGFTVGAAGCSYCLGVAVDKAADGEIWLSSQNRNFRNRMGRGAIGNITSAAVVCVSSFEMSITDPTKFLQSIDYDRYDKMIDLGPIPESITYMEPSPSSSDADVDMNQGDGKVKEFSVIKGRAQVFGDDVDTDAIIPAKYIPLRDAELGDKSFCIYRPEFVERVKGGQTIVVAGNGFGCGSSREEAVSCLRWCGVECVIAKSYSFIFGRNLLNLNLFGICIDDPEFYKSAQENVEISVDVPNRVVLVADKKFPFALSSIQEEIYKQEGVVSMYQNYGHMLFKRLADVPADTSCGAQCGQKW